jgi:ElaB/YqjD/DUF883 family membrane-anchored ribosome-binding protein
MNTNTIRDSVEDLKDTARGAYEEMKTAARERVLEPLADTSRHWASTARHSAEQAADYGRRTVARTGEWASANPFSAAGIAFGAGLIAGVCLLSRFRR